MLVRMQTNSGGGGAQGIATGEFDITGMATPYTIETGIPNVQGIVIVGDVLTSYPATGQPIAYWNSKDTANYYEFKGVGSYTGGYVAIGTNNGYASICIKSIADVANGNIDIETGSGSYGTAITNGHYRWFAW